MLRRAVLALLLATLALGSPFQQRQDGAANAAPPAPPPESSAPPAAGAAPPGFNGADTLASILGLLGTLAQAKAAQPPSDAPGKFDGAVGQLLAKLTGGSPDLPALLE